MICASCWCIALLPAVVYGAAFPSTATPPPVFSPFKRQPSVGNRTCGFVSGVSESLITCSAAHAVCATNTHHGVQGCCDSASLSACVLPTTCIPGTAVSTACTEAACLTNAAIAKCTGRGMDECRKLLVVFPTTTMTQYGCAASSTRLIVQRFLSATALSQEIKTVTVTATATALSAGTLTSASDDSHSHTHSSSTTGAVVGGTIGACILLTILILAVFLCCRRRKEMPYHPPLAHLDNPSVVPNAEPFRIADTEAARNRELWRQHQKYQALRPSQGCDMSRQMPPYPGMAHDGVMQLDSMERPTEVPISSRR